MLTCRVYRDGVLAEEGFDPALISDRLEEPDTLVWLDIEDPTHQDLAMIQEEFDLHHLAIEDAERLGQRPKVEPYDGYLFVVARAAAIAGEGVAEQEVHAFAASRYLISLRQPGALDPAAVQARAERHPDLVREGGGFLLHALLDEVVDEYLRAADLLEARSEEIQEAVFADVVPEDLQESLFRLRKQVQQMRRAVAPARDLVMMLQGDRRVVTPALDAYYRDVADHVLRALGFLDSVRELLTTALEAHLSQISNRLNLVMRKLTSWAAIILVPTLIAGVYGMNFRHMPELLWRFGYAWALGLMALTGLGLYVAFKRRGWL